MNKTISAYDVLLADDFAGWTQFDLINPSNIEIVTEVLGRLGFDVNNGILVTPANHRTMRNSVGVGYMFCGTIAAGREHVRGAYSTEHERFASAEMTDNGLYDELLAMSSRCSSYGIDNAPDDKIPEMPDPEQRAEEVRITKEIALLAELLYIARGDQRKLDGSVKCLWDYLNPETPPKKRNRKKPRKNEQQGV